MFEIEPPRDTAALRRELARQQENIAESMKAFSDDDFFTPQVTGEGEHWAPSGHIRHLSKCIRPVSMAMKLPKLLLRLRFGKSKSGSRSFEEIKAHYLEKLHTGEAQAGGYAPSDTEPELSKAEWREQIMRHFDEAGSQLDAALAAWSEKQLDTLQLVHPILGAMTIREMLYFTLYHNVHHARRVHERAS